MRAWLQRLRKLAALPPAERRDLVRAQAALVAAQLRVWTQPAGRLVRPGAAEPSSDPATSADAERAGKLALAVDRAAEGGLFRPACLVRSLALHRLLARDGVRGVRIRVGVRPGGGGLSAHAWVEVGGEALGDDGRRAGAFHAISGGALLPARAAGR